MHEGMQAIRSEIQVGWRVDMRDYAYTPDSREGTVVALDESGITIKPSRPWRSQGMTFPLTLLLWVPHPGSSEREYGHRKVHLYRTPPRHTGKPRELARTYTFTPPRPY